VSCDLPEVADIELVHMVARDGTGAKGDALQVLLYRLGALRNRIDELENLIDDQHNNLCADWPNNRHHPNCLLESAGMAANQQEPKP
jgi:tetrahydromethanopterin S-methyltransferase subunit B